MSLHLCLDYKNPMAKYGNYPKDLTGLRFGRLLAVAIIGRTSQGRCVWECRCDCGVITKTTREHLTRTQGHTRSCGCLYVETVGHELRTHGLSNVLGYSNWVEMRRRCNDPTRPEYPRYGGRGIKVCARWFSFQNFIDDMGPPPSAVHSIDRIDNDGDYCPENCRWATFVEQARNNRRNINLTHRGITQCVAAWEQCLGFKEGLVSKRLKRNWTIERALDTPPQGSQWR